MQVSRFILGLGSLTSLTAAAPFTIVDSVSTFATSGDVVVCQNGLNNGPCERFNAQNRCVNLGDSVSHKVRTIHQAAGTICRYFESDCSAHTPVLSINSRSKPFLHEFDRSIGDRIGLVLCRTHWPPIESGDASGDIQDSEDSQTLVSATMFEKRSSNAGLILVADQAEERGNKQTINVAIDSDNCAPIREPIYWNVQSLYQWKGAICTYWKWDCGQGRLHDNMPVFTVDSRGSMQHLRYLPESFGDDRHRVGWIRCVYGDAANAFMADLDVSNMTIIGGEHATVDTAALLGTPSGSAVLQPSHEKSLPPRAAPEAPSSPSTPQDLRNSGSQPGDTKTCNLVDFQHCRNNVNAMGA